MDTGPDAKKKRADAPPALSTAKGFTGKKPLFPKKDSRPIYKHKWAEDDEEEEETGSSNVKVRSLKLGRLEF